MLRCRSTCRWSWHGGRWHLSGGCRTASRRSGNRSRHKRRLPGRAEPQASGSRGANGTPHGGSTLSSRLSSSAPGQPGVRGAICPLQAVAGCESRSGRHMGRMPHGNLLFLAARKDGSAPGSLPATWQEGRCGIGSPHGFEPRTCPMVKPGSALRLAAPCRAPTPRSGAGAPFCVPRWQSGKTDPRRAESRYHARRAVAARNETAANWQRVDGWNSRQAIGPGSLAGARPLRRWKAVAMRKSATHDSRDRPAARTCCVPTAWARAG